MPKVRGRRSSTIVLGLSLTLLAAAIAAVPATVPAADDDAGAVASGGGLAISSLGRIEPEHGILFINAPSMVNAVNGAVLRKLYVEAGENVTAGQILAETDAAAVEEAEVEVRGAQLQLAERQSEKAVEEEQDVCSRSAVAQRTSERRSRLLSSGVTSDEEADVAAGDAKALSGSCAAARIATKAAASAVDVARAHLKRAQAERDRAYVRAPIDGRVLRIITRPGELLALDGLLELANVSRMYAIAEIYETDVRRVHKGQKATVTSAALEGPLTGVVEHVRLMVRKQDATGTDPAARKDARIVEVEVLLDNPEAVASLSNLQVDVLIHP